MDAVILDPAPTDGLITDDLAGGAGELAAKVQAAQSVLAQAVARANLGGDPVGVALEAMSVSLGAQLALHEANTGHFWSVRARLEQQLVQAQAHSRQALEARRSAIIDSLAPELEKLATRLPPWSRMLPPRAMLAAGAVAAALVAAALAFGGGLAGYAVGWQAGHGSAVSAGGTLLAAVQQAGPQAEAALVDMVRANDLVVAWSRCRQFAVAEPAGRRVCMMPLWADPQQQPAG